MHNDVARIVDWIADVRDDISRLLFRNKAAIYLLQHHRFKGYNVFQQKAARIQETRAETQANKEEKRIRCGSNERFIGNSVKASRMAASSATLIGSTILGLMNAAAENMLLHNRALFARYAIMYLFLCEQIIENYVA